MDKSFIINDIKKHFNYEKDADFARFLGITPQTLSNWKARNTYDPELLYTKCVVFNAEWILTGEGEKLKENTRNERDHDIFKEKYLVLLEKNMELHEENKKLKEQIASTQEISFPKQRPYAVAEDDPKGLAGSKKKLKKSNN